MKIKVRKTIISGAIFLLLVAALYILPGIINIDSLPDHIFLSNGITKKLEISGPVKLHISNDSLDVLSLEGTTLGEGTYSLNQPITIEPRQDGTAQLSFEVLGIPLKTVTVTVDNNKKLIPGGESIGVMLYTKGALVVGASDIVAENGKRVNPAKDAGLKSGDVIEKVNGATIEDAENLSELVNELSGETIKLEIERNNVTQEINITPVKDSEDGVYRLGIWVRDSTAGVGTLTFYDPSSNRFAGLGHPITDLDTGELLSVKNGEIIVSDIIEISKGYNGEPGELKGNFNTHKAKLGKINENTTFGIYGDAYENISNPLFTEPLSICPREEVQLGAAQILTTIDDKGVRAFDCEIVKLNQQNEPEAKSLVIEVTDPELLEKTGGIVQGMSGSPIIQNGRIVGAVTHVFVNDPKMGYGLYIDWMLYEMYN